MNGSEYCRCNEGQLKEMPSPLFRLVCHCKTCQDFFNQGYNDECTFLLNECHHLDLSEIEFKGYQKGFSPIKRGKCKSCGKPSYCKVKFGPFAEFITVPSEGLKSIEIPPPFAHIYYGSRCEQMDDNIKKINGHYRSQAAILWAVLEALTKRRTNA